MNARLIISGTIAFFFTTPGVFYLLHWLGRFWVYLAHHLHSIYNFIVYGDYTSNMYYADGVHFIKETLIDGGLIWKLDTPLLGVNKIVHFVLHSAFEPYDFFIVALCSSLISIPAFMLAKLPDDEDDYENVVWAGYFLGLVFFFPIIYSTIGAVGYAVFKPFI